MLNKIFLVVPKLIEQQTWGGDYILRFKKWSAKKDFKNLKIGQSYELFFDSKLRSDLTTSEDSSFTGERGYSMEPGKILYSGRKTKLIGLKELIKKDPLAILGQKVLAVHGKQPGILIKFTQAKGNSFQIHVREKDESSKWKTKPESWYYLQPGLLTLGVKHGINWPAYEKTCSGLEKQINNLGLLVKKKKLSYLKAQKKIKQILKQHNPWQFVNFIKVKKDELVDLSSCGLHHSWEKDEKNYPLGNIVYELCKDVMDPVSTLRSFDQGMIKKDGSVRKLNIKEYFKYINRSKEINNPQSHIFNGKVLFDKPEIKVLGLLRSKYYSLDKIVLKKSYSGLHTETKQSYHHLFVQKGSVLVKAEKNKIKISKGHACFIPNCLGRYELITDQAVEILKTFIV